MKKGLKILSVMALLSTLTIAGCSCNKDDKTNVSRIDNSTNSILGELKNGANDYTLLDVYNALIAEDAGNKVVANKLVELVANEVLELNKTESVWKTRYDNLVKEKMKEKAESTDYQVKKEFSEKYLVEALKADGYAITCPDAVVYGTVDNLACDYTSYINQEIRAEVISTLLKQKYIIDETLVNRANIITNKKVRDVEYLTISSSLDDEYDELSVRDFVRGIRDRIANNEVVDLKAVADEFKTELKSIVETEYNKIGTDKDSSGSINAEYTNNSTQSAATGYQTKLDSINDAEYYFDKIISSDSDSASIVSETITSSVLSVTDPTNTSFARKVVKVTDSSNNVYYYLVSANAGTTITAKDILLSETSDSKTYTYSIVRFRVINSDTTDENDKYEAVKLLASESTLASGALAHYIEEKKDTISVYDDDVKAYLKTLYPDVFVD